MVAERFNFYDIYGYLIPGFALVALLWVPFALMFPEWRNVEWSSAFVALIPAYACGLLVNRLTAPYVRISIYDAASHTYKHPSYLVFERNPPSGLKLPHTVLAGVVEGIRTTFGIDVMADTDSRDDVLLLCRRVLQTDAPSYAEQFQGLYTFSLTFAAVLVIAAYYVVGWVLSRFISMPVAMLAVAALAIVFSIMFLRQSKYTVLVFPFLFAAIGATAAIRSELDPAWSPFLLAMAIAACVLSIPFYNFYRYFSNVFTTTIYRDFYVLTQASNRVRRSGGGHERGG